MSGLKNEVGELIDKMNSDLQDMKDATEGNPLGDYAKGYSRGVIDTFIRFIKIIKHIHSKMK